MQRLQSRASALVLAVVCVIAPRAAPAVSHFQYPHWPRRAPVFGGASGFGVGTTVGTASIWGLLVRNDLISETAFLRSVISLSRFFILFSWCSFTVACSWSAYSIFSWRLSSTQALQSSRAFLPRAKTPFIAVSLRPVQFSVRCIRRPQKKQSQELSFFRIFSAHVEQQSEINFIRWRVLCLDIFQGLRARDSISAP